MKPHKKACEQCPHERVAIGKNYFELPIWRRTVGALIIYIPLFTSLPFVLLGGLLLYAHLRALGAQDVKSYWDYVPTWTTHRYHRLRDQLTMQAQPHAPWLAWKSFWMFNCNLYCPLSVALYEWSTYLVKLVENYWCPFFHEKKAEYAEAAVDYSYWHVMPEDIRLLHPDDRDCAIWNQDAAPLEGAPETGGQ